MQDALSTNEVQGISQVQAAPKALNCLGLLRRLLQEVH